MVKKNILILALIIAPLILITIIIAYTSMPNPGHGGDKIHIYINGANKTLQQAITDNEFIPPFLGRDAGFKITNYISGHNSSEIYVNASGTIKSLQASINDFSICDISLEDTLSHTSLGHPAEKIVITINSQEKTLQEAIVQDLSCCSDVDLDNYDNCEIGDPGDDGNEIDCNDSDDEMNPEETEVCDGKDNDCDGDADEEGVCVTWVAAYAQNCDYACPIGTRNVGPHKCTAGETISAGAVNQLGSGIYIHGCWDVACTVDNARPLTQALEPVGAYCYHTGQKTDWDATDITVACACV
jgi:hypothetical protein